MRRRDKINSHSSRRSRRAFPGEVEEEEEEKEEEKERRATRARIVKTSINARPRRGQPRDKMSENEEEDEVHRGCICGTNLLVYGPCARPGASI